MLTFRRGQFPNNFIFIYLLRDPAISVLLWQYFMLLHVKITFQLRPNTPVSMSKPWSFTTFSLPTMLD